MSNRESIEADLVKEPRERAPFRLICVFFLLVGWTWYWPILLGNYGVASDGIHFSTTTALTLTLISLATPCILIMSLIELSFRIDPFPRLKFFIVVVGMVSILPMLYLALQVFILWYWNH